MYKLLILIPTLKRFRKDLIAISPHFLTRLYFYVDYLFAFIIHGASPRDYTLCKLYKHSLYERFSYLTMRRASRIEKWFNDSHYSGIYNRKHLFNAKFENFVTRDWIYTPDSSNDDIECFLNKHSLVIYKPINLSSGKGIKKINVNQIHNIKDFIIECKRDNILLEECIKQAEFFNSLNPHSVNSIRIYTILDKYGVPNVLAAGLKAGTTESIVDNMHDNGVYYPLDPKTGVVKSLGMNIHGQSFLFHPNTGIKMLGLQVPQYNQLIKFVKDATHIVKECRYIGWDIAVTDDGFEMIEGNVTPYIADHQVYDNKGYYPLFLKYK